MVLWGNIATDVTNSLQLRSEKCVILVLRFGKIKDRSVSNAYNVTDVQLHPNMAGLRNLGPWRRLSPSIY
ncbi:hypothetical protein IGI04_002148 [Brassica rapa subsp. trilocularis]|uniref:Uncharacterized protein n=1 Tax=Brassica rapa subsp. trilocularis TaxID=1813537 RepID=A0ABQ7NVL5_BRACM|nr:hypothetical protein IGI04_030276 [Brassica rapa subsp. trilocularis]KAG5414581.1 hypothetical protein IGI04_002148 [Brassica rapa subsp. trilocularis]